MPGSFNILAALAEVSSKSAEEIEAETAYKWASRAVAYYWLWRRRGDLNYRLRAESARHEAGEHAAGADRSGAELRKIEDELDAYFAAIDAGAEIE